MIVLHVIQERTQMSEEENKTDLARVVNSVVFDPDIPIPGAAAVVEKIDMAKGLRSALLKHQAKIHKQDRSKARQAAALQQARQKAASNKPRNKRAPKERNKYIVPFNQEDSILLLGEGNVSLF